MKLFGIIGKPLGHSFSRLYFNEKFERESINARYDLRPLESIDELPELVNSVPDLVGLNVTIPYKQQVIPFLDELDETAQEVGAVNVIRVTRNNGKVHLKGFNSDAYGFEESLKPILKPYHKKALILGTGGASKAVAYVLGKLDIEYTFVSRTAGENKITYLETDQSLIEDHLLIVNTTPVGMTPNTDVCPDIPYQFLTDKHLLYDVIYTPEKTLFLQRGEEKGCMIKNGHDMLLLQAAGAWKMWNGEK